MEQHQLTQHSGESSEELGLPSDSFDSQSPQNRLPKRIAIVSGVLVALSLVLALFFFKPRTVAGNDAAVAQTELLFTKDPDAAGTCTNSQKSDGTYNPDCCGSETTWCDHCSCGREQCCKDCSTIKSSSKCQPEHGCMWDDGASTCKKVVKCPIADGTAVNDETCGCGSKVCDPGKTCTSTANTCEAPKNGPATPAPPALTPAPTPAPVAVATVALQQPLEAGAATLELADLSGVAPGMQMELKSKTGHVEMFTITGVTSVRRLSSDGRRLGGGSISFDPATQSAFGPGTVMILTVPPGSCFTFACPAGMAPIPAALAATSTSEATCCEDICQGHTCPVGMIKKFRKDAVSLNQPSDGKCCEACPVGYTQLGKQSDDIPGWGVSPYVGFKAHSETDCAAQCNKVDECGGIKWQFSTKECALVEKEKAVESALHGHWGGAIICKKARCVTTGNYPCAFPFKYAGRTYEKCTSQDHDKDWCATELDVLGVAVSGKWGECSEACKEPESSEADAGSTPASTPAESMPASTPADAGSAPAPTPAVSAPAPTLAVSTPAPTPAVSAPAPTLAVSTPASTPAVSTPASTPAVSTPASTADPTR